MPLATPRAQAKYNLRWGHYLADSPFVQLEKDFVAAIEKRTNGQVKINITFSEGLGKTTELLMLTSKGAIDMTATAPGYNPDQLHYWRAFQTAAHLHDEQAGDGRARHRGRRSSRSTTRRWTARAWSGCSSSRSASTT